MNLLREERYKEVNLHLMVDPDILLPSNGLNELCLCIEKGADISTILVQMHYFQQATYIIHRQTRYFDFRNFRKWEIDELKFMGADIIEVDNATTALMLITREVAKKMQNVRYIEGLIWGHDVIFSQDARVLGFKIMCSLNAEALHLQPEETYFKMKDANIIDLWLT
jgi:GT2 family glycosyltransferase